MTEVPVTDWANYEGDLPEQYPHRQPRKLNRGTEPIAGPDRKAYGKEKRRRLKARSPTLTVTKVETNKKIPRLDDITFENGLVTGYSKSKNAKVGDKFVVTHNNGRFVHILDAEEDSTPIAEPMELGEMANWTPLDGSEGLKRKRAEERECNVCDYTDSQGQPHPFCEKCRNHKGSCCRCVGSSDWEDHQREFPEIEYRADSPSATIPVSEPSWVKPVATALGFGLGFLGIRFMTKEL